MELREIEEYTANNKEQQALDEFVKFVEKKYNVKVHKAVFRYDENSSKIDFIDVYLQTTFEQNAVLFSEDKRYWKQYFLEEGRLLCDILEKQSLCFSHCFELGLHILFRSFETEAMEACYSMARKENMRTLKEKYFNPTTMEIIHYPLFVVYKTKADMINAERSGEQARITEEFYDLIKKYDKYNYITREKHLLVHFDYSGHARTPREYSDLYSDMLR